MNYDYIVDGKGRGDFLTIQEAIDASSQSLWRLWRRPWLLLRRLFRREVRIHVWVGDYRESLTIGPDARVALFGAEVDASP
jgi:hypothetical protein